MSVDNKIQEVKQQLFNNGYIGLARQQAWSKKKDTRWDIGKGSPAYRGNGGRKCFIGFSIADDCYSIALENNTAGSGVVVEALFKSGYDVSADTYFIQDMQYECHHSRSGFEFSLSHARQFAKKHGLTIPEIKGGE